MPDKKFIQFDHKVRVVSIFNLETMCKRVSSVCHRFNVVKITDNSIHVEYSNPDEYANDHPIIAVFPCYKGIFDATYVVLDIKRMITHGNDPFDTAWQAFDVLLDCPELFRDPNTLEWATREEIEQKTIKLKE